MRATMGVKLVSVLVVGFVVMAAGCGSSHKKSASPTTTSTAPTTTTTGATTQTKTPAPTFASAHNCKRLAALGAAVAKSLQPTAGNLQATVANEAKVLQAMVDAAPSEIRGDFETFVSTFNGYVQALAKAGFKPGTTPTAAQIAQLESAAKAFNTPKLLAAEQHLSAWAQKNCTASG